MSAPLLFNCHSLHHLMTGKPTSKAEVLSEGAKTYVLDVYLSKIHRRKEDAKPNKFFDKGHAREEDAITLLSRLHKVYLTKNSTRLEDDFLTGEPDTYIGNELLRAEILYDTKCSFSLHTFARAAMGKLKTEYYWQGQGYMKLTGAKEHNVAYCLVNGTHEQIVREKKFLKWRMDETSDEYRRACQQIERNHIFDVSAFIDENPTFEWHSDPLKWSWDIAMEKRLSVQRFERDEEAIRAIEKNVYAARYYIEKHIRPLFPK